MFNGGVLGESPVFVCSIQTVFLHGLCCFLFYFLILLYLYAVSGWMQIACPRSMCNDNEVRSNPIQWMSILSFNLSLIEFLGWRNFQSRFGKSCSFTHWHTPPLILFWIQFKHQYLQIFAQTEGHLFLRGTPACLDYTQIIVRLPFKGVRMNNEWNLPQLATRHLPYSVCPCRVQRETPYISYTKSSFRDHQPSLPCRKLSTKSQARRG